MTDRPAITILLPWQCTALKWLAWTGVVCGLVAAIACAWPKVDAWLSRKQPEQTVSKIVDVVREPVIVWQERDPNVPYTAGGKAARLPVVFESGLCRWNDFPKGDLHWGVVEVVKVRPDAEATESEAPPASETPVPSVPPKQGGNVK